MPRSFLDLIHKILCPNVKTERRLQTPTRVPLKIPFAIGTRQDRFSQNTLLSFFAQFNLKNITNVVAAILH